MTDDTRELEKMQPANWIKLVAVFALTIILFIFLLCQIIK